MNILKLSKRLRTIRDIVDTKLIRHIEIVKYRFLRPIKWVFFVIKNFYCKAKRIKYSLNNQGDYKGKIYSYILLNASYQIFPNKNSIDVKNGHIECDPYLSSITVKGIDAINKMTDEEFYEYVSNIIAHSYIRHSKFSNALKMFLSICYFNESGSYMYPRQKMRTFIDL